jgi:MerR family mercuric resistance operon transcriptional regulator
MEKLTIGKLAKKSGVGVETVRFYQRKELLSEPKSTGAIRTYSDDDTQRIIFIKKVQELGFSLAEIKELLEFNTRPRTTCEKVKQKTIAKIEEIDQKISNLIKMRTSLENLSCVCRDTRNNGFKAYKVQDCFEVGSVCE